MDRIELHQRLQELAIWLQTPEGKAHVEQIRKDCEITAERLRKDSEIPYHILIQPMTV